MFLHSTNTSLKYTIISHSSVATPHTFHC